MITYRAAFYKGKTRKEVESLMLKAFEFRALLRAFLSSASPHGEKWQEPGLRSRTPGLALLFTPPELHQKLIL